MMWRVELGQMDSEEVRRFDFEDYREAMEFAHTVFKSAESLANLKITIYVVAEEM